MDADKVAREDAPDLACALAAIGRAMDGNAGVPGTFNDQGENRG